MVEIIEEIIEAEAAAEQAVSLAKADAATQKREVAERHAREIADAKSAAQQGAQNLIVSAKNEANHPLGAPDEEFDSYAASHTTEFARAVESIVELILRSEIDIGLAPPASDPTLAPVDLGGGADVSETRSG